MPRYLFLLIASIAFQYPGGYAYAVLDLARTYPDRSAGVACRRRTAACTRSPSLRVETLAETDAGTVRFSYTYDALDRVRSITHAAGSRRIDYQGRTRTKRDELGRAVSSPVHLTQVSRTSWQGFPNQEVQMRKSKFIETQIVSILKQADAGLPVKDVCRQAGISVATYCHWKPKFGGTDASELKRVRA